MHSIYKKETPARIKGEAVENESKLHLSEKNQEKKISERILNLINIFENSSNSMKSNSNVVSMAKFQIYGRETNQPMRCTEKEATRLDLSVT